MKVIDDVIAQLSENPHCGSSCFLGEALASACNSNYKVSMLDASVKLDMDSKRLLLGLMQIAQQPDYSNSDQSKALTWLRENEYID